MRLNFPRWEKVRWAILACGLLVAAPGAAAAAGDDDPWPDLREALFGTRPIQDGDGVIDLEAPQRAYDAAIVPVTVLARIPQTPERYIKEITLIIDKNPAPVAAVFRMTPMNGDATVATRVRVNEYTHVRAVAETNDGALYMATKFVKAAGGCSAPALKDHEKAAARLGRMKLKQLAPGELGAPAQAQLLISHPNHSGLQLDQITRYYVPARFVQDIEVSYGGRKIMTVEGAISLSEDPSIHFRYLPDGAEEIHVRVRDSDDSTFTARWPVAPGPGS